MDDDQFTKLFKYVEETRGEASEIKRSMATRDDIRELTTTIEGTPRS
ncbi:MAG: hypothetical protein ABI397_02470 [Candidatus Saccharimonas sp.]